MTEKFKPGRDEAYEDGYIRKSAIKDPAEAEVRASAENQMRNRAPVSPEQKLRDYNSTQKHWKKKIDTAADEAAMYAGYDDQAIIDIASKISPEKFPSYKGITKDNLATKLTEIDEKTRAVLIDVLKDAEQASHHTTIEGDHRPKQVPARGNNAMGYEIKKAKRTVEKAQDESGGRFSLGRGRNYGAIHSTESTYEGDTIDFDHGR